jgi:hypothetical protein
MILKVGKYLFEKVRPGWGLSPGAGLGPYLKRPDCGGAGNRTQKQNKRTKNLISQHEYQYG